jgi:hypothetical protein
LASRSRIFLLSPKASLVQAYFKKPCRVLIHCSYNIALNLLSAK